MGPSGDHRELRTDAADLVAIPLVTELSPPILRPRPGAAALPETEGGGGAGAGGLVLQDCGGTALPGAIEGSVPMRWTSWPFRW